MFVNKTVYLYLYDNYFAIPTCRVTTLSLDPAFWKYEDAQAKILVYYPRNEVKSCEYSSLPNRE